MRYMYRGKKLSILFNATCIKIVERETLQNATISMGIEVGIGNHAAYLFFCTMVVAFMVAFISIAKWISGNMYRALHTRSNRNFESQKMITFKNNFHQIGFRQKIHRNFLRIISTIPKSFFVCADLINRQTFELQLVFLLFYTQHNNTPLGIGKSRIGIPKFVWKTTFGRFVFYFVRFAFGKSIEHP